VAYKQWTENSYKTYNAYISAISDELPKAGYPDNDAYLAKRNQAVGDYVTINPSINPWIIVGQKNTYRASDDVYKYYVRRGVFFFRNSRSIMASAPIEYAKLEVYKLAESGEINFTVVVTNGQPTYPHAPPVVADYDITHYSGNGGQLVNPTGIGWKEIVLNADGRNFIDITEDYIAKLCLVTQDDIDSTAPLSQYDDGYQHLLISSDTRAKLTIRVTLSIPTAQTDEETEQGASSAVFNGEITDSGYWLDSYGFEWKQGEEGDITAIEVGTNRTTGLVFEYEKTGLSGTIYYRAYGTNGAGTGYGEWEAIVFASITTQAATNITYDYALGNGTIVAGEDITERGFEVKFELAAMLGDYVFHHVAGFEPEEPVDFNVSTGNWEATMIKTITEENGFEAGAYTGDLAKQPYPMYYDTLFKCESYTYRAYMVIDDTTYTGDWVAFDTLCDAGEEQQPTDDISEGNPVVPIIPIEPIDIIEEEIPPFEWEEPEIEIPPFIFPDLPPWEFPDYPPMSFVGDFYYRRPYTKKDLDDLRKKCIIYSKNSIEFALVLRHNMNVLREFFNMMTDYMDKEEFNDFTDLIPPQRLKELYLDPLNPTDFRDMINGFIRNTIDNNIAVNRNFKLIQDGLSEYETESDDAYFKEINSNIKTVTEDDPDVHRLKRKINSLNQEVASNFGSIMRNLKVLRARLL